MTNTSGPVGLAFKGTIGGEPGEVTLAVSGVARDRNAAAADGPGATDLSGATELPAREGRR